MAVNIFQYNYLSRNPIEQAMRHFGKKFNTDKKILDIGCGKKPYAKYFKCQYLGLDPFDTQNADIVADSWDIPSENNIFDGIILNQSLEHIKKTDETIAEIKRILKPGGIGIITAPQTMKNHGIIVPSKKEALNNFDKDKLNYWRHDYFRFTKFGLIYLFRDFEILEIKETSGYFSTILQLINYFLYSLGKELFFPVYFFNNILALFLDKLFYFVSKSGVSIFKYFYTITYESLTLNYILIIKKNSLL
ncbi:MAG: hypothetical protein A2271_03140 [Candidatus Moranbacteria bacterium RIFOXYA12_FULL_35_19]|nr:MAG: Methylase/methyltransferase [Candidatus Moranbacteria bacterium GW2011_GWF2_35_39]OGI32309.1 MAG: hypothetical protein A2489_03145 [Candidatus Moranbacteria bacterium RIFOXYC12_FULL_36_13]OGI36569.1 MAG: hypothetical protein A2271_03140 [Candidatus Moranbacteria bacterium RIFOXYA12_FULL_35_19]